jgi:hypothetical protein
MTAEKDEPNFALLVLPESTPASIYGLYEVFSPSRPTGIRAGSGRSRPSGCENAMPPAR